MQSPTLLEVDALVRRSRPSRTRHGCGRRLKFGGIFCGDVSFRGYVTICDLCRAAPLQLREVKAGMWIHGCGPAWHSPAPFWSFYALGERILHHVERSFFALELAADIDALGGFHRSGLRPRTTPLVVACPECKRWNYHLSGCSRRGLR